MSTLSTSRPRLGAASDVDARFDAIVRLVPAQRSLPARPSTPSDVDFETVFDLDHGQPVTAVEPREAAPAPVVELRPRAHLTRPRPSASRVRLTRRGRAVVVLAFLALTLALMVPMSGWATATLTGGSPEPVRIVEVQPGDTLYGIAGDLAAPGGVREMVHRIQELNSLPGGQIAVGQRLAVPRG